MMKQKWGLDRNVLLPTPGDPWGVEKHHWNTGAEENQQLNPGGPSIISEVRCIIFSETAPKSPASTTTTLQSWLHPSDATPSVLSPPTSVCEIQFDLINIFCWYETKNVSGIYRTFHNGDWWSRIRTIGKCGQFSYPWFCAPDTIFPRKMYFSAIGRCCSKRYLWRKIEISMLYFSPNSLLTLHRINVLKKAKHRLLTCRHPGTRRVWLHLVSEVRNSVASSMQRVNTALFKTNSILCFS